MQLAEALGPDNRWFCAQALGKTVDDPETLLKYFIKSGGAEDFAARFDEAMGPLNRWYCSEHYECEISSPEILWKYYISRGTVVTGTSEADSVSPMQLARY